MSHTDVQLYKSFVIESSTYTSYHILLGLVLRCVHTKQQPAGVFATSV